VCENHIETGLDTQQPRKGMLWYMKYLIFRLYYRDNYLLTALQGIRRLVKNISIWFRLILLFIECLHK